MDATATPTTPAAPRVKERRGNKKKMWTQPHHHHLQDPSNKNHRRQKSQKNTKENKAAHPPCPPRKALLPICSGGTQLLSSGCTGAYTEKFAARGQEGTCLVGCWGRRQERENARAQRETERETERERERERERWPRTHACNTDWAGTACPVLAGRMAHPFLPCPHWRWRWHCPLPCCWGGVPCA